MRVEIWSDIACPWCYIGKARFEQGLASFAHRDEVEVVHRSFELEPHRGKADIVPVTDVLVEKYGRTPQEARAMEEDVAEVARGEGLDYSTVGREAGNTFDVHRLLHLARARGRQNALLDLAYHANFTEKRSVFVHEDLVTLAVEAGLDEAEAKAVLADEAAYADEVRADEREAAELGATGVPFFVLDRRYGVSGGQPAEVFAQALEQAWDARTPLTTLTPAADATDATDAATCGPDGCEVPQVKSDV
ncbi:DsbA family oxidoreductase [Streptomyces boluensis]|uniref:DsbA family oxidoreductase n=1 Tax=Streptomyces boluensis TaxID=1775135 RepID=A0A964UXB5_9ACTN|nr:DsbA family oxidoreductase [Streptomyces boluensis]NBE56236.1 DsbA family oxidoreductase [Streptomyces boluensis]